MPLVKIFHGSNFTEETVEKVNQTIHDALIECFQIPENDTFQLWISTDATANFVDTHYLLPNGKRDREFLYLEIFCGPGRTVEQKQLLYQTIVAKMEPATSLSKQNIFILLNEVSLENWSFGDGKAQMIAF